MQLQQQHLNVHRVKVCRCQVFLESLLDCHEMLPRSPCTFASLARSRTYTNRSLYPLLPLAAATACLFAREIAIKMHLRVTMIRETRPNAQS